MQSEDLIRTARKYSYVREVRPNSGPWIDDALAFVGCEPGCSWCAAAVCMWIHETDPTFVFHKSASALSLGDLNQHLVVPFEDIQPGDIVIECHDAAKHLGHVSIATDVVRMNGKVNGLTTIAGNTSVDGKSRNGDRVAEHPHDLPDPRIVAVLRVCSQTPAASS